jgi:hypothetical protein
MTEGGEVLQRQVMAPRLHCASNLIVSSAGAAQDVLQL